MALNQSEAIWTIAMCASALYNGMANKLIFNGGMHLHLQLIKYYVISCFVKKKKAIYVDVKATDSLGLKE